MEGKGNGQYIHNEVENILCVACTGQERVFVYIEISQNCDTKYVFATEWLVICIDSSPAVARATNDQGHNAIIIFSPSYAFSLIWHMWNMSES